MDNVQNNQPLSDAPTPKSPPQGVWDGTEAIGSITSPAKTGLYRMALRDYAANLQIEFGLFCLDYDEYSPDGKLVKKTVLCQASSMELKNSHHENALMRALIREKGRIPGLSGFADHKEVSLLPLDSIVATDKGEVPSEHQLPANLPPTGTPVRFASTSDIKNFAGNHQALFNIGYLYRISVPLGLTLV